MYFRQLYDEGLAQASYILGSPDSREAMVVDPLRDVDQYFETVRRHGFRIKAVAETHIHADYLSGGRELADAADARLYISGETVSGWRYGGLDGLKVGRLHDGDILWVGDVKFEALHTPGHTPEHLSFLVTDTDSGDAPMMLLSGDFAFVGDLGRPDLLETAAGQMGTAKEGAKQAYDSIEQALLPLADHVQIWPAHGAGSACGKALGDIPSSTVGFEQSHAWWSEFISGTGQQDAFVEEFLADQPETPTYYRFMKEMNRDGPTILGELPSPPPLTPGRFQTALKEEALLLDLRDIDDFARGHIPGAINISDLQKLSVHAGDVAPYDERLLLLCEPVHVEEATRRLIRIGLDDIIGYVPRLEQYAPEPLESFEMVSADRARRMWERDDSRVLDVRSESEWRAGHIPEALHIHYGNLPEHSGQLPGSGTLIVHCEKGVRASIAASLLLANGYENLVVFPDGFGAWKRAGYPVEK